MGICYGTEVTDGLCRCLKLRITSSMTSSLARVYLYHHSLAWSSSVVDISVIASRRGDSGVAYGIYMDVHLHPYSVTC